MALVLANRPQANTQPYPQPNITFVKKKKSKKEVLELTNNVEKSTDKPMAGFC